MGRSGWDINSDQELCSLANQWIDSIPIEVGDNLRIRSEETGVDAAYTVARTHDDSGDQQVRMGSSARDKMYPDTTTADYFDATFVSNLPNITSRSESEAQSREEMFEETVIHPSHSFAVTAPHAGDVEHHTTEQARACHDYHYNSSLWICNSFDDAAYPTDFNRWHITSTDLSGRSHPGLSRMEDVGYDAAVSFHGYGNNEILIGGRAPMEFREQLADTLGSIGAADARAADDEPYDGDNPDNFVNRITASGDDGIQIEQPGDFRTNHSTAAAQAVAKEVLAYYG